MSDLVVIVYPTQEKAEEVRTRLFELQKEYIIKLADAVIATKSADGQVQLHQVVNTTASGAVSGTFWGLLIGILFLNPLLGAAAGAAGGALGGALTDFGINDQFMKQLAESIHAGDAALFVLIKEMTADKVIEQIKDYGGVVLKTSLTDAKEQALRQLSLAPWSPIRPRRWQAFRPDPAPLSSHQGGPAALMDGWRRASHVSFKG
jgi:uncharacterized membrane protein